MNSDAPKIGVGNHITETDSFTTRELHWQKMTNSPEALRTNLLITGAERKGRKITQCTTIKWNINAYKIFNSRCHS